MTKQSQKCTLKHLLKMMIKVLFFLYLVVYLFIFNISIFLFVYFLCLAACLFIFSCSLLARFLAGFRVRALSFLLFSLFYFYFCVLLFIFYLFSFFSLGLQNAFDMYPFTFPPFSCLPRLHQISHQVLKFFKSLFTNSKYSF